MQADLAYPDAIAALRRAGNAIVELGQFATQPFDNLQAAQTVISALHNGVYLICASLNEEQLRIVFEVNPHHVKYWCSLGWQVIGPPRLCDRVNAPGVLMVMDFADYTQTMLQCWPLHARNQQVVHRAWQRVIRYSMLWEDVDGVLARIGNNRPSHSDAAQHGPASDVAMPAVLPNFIPTDLPVHFQPGSSHA